MNYYNEIKNKLIDNEIYQKVKDYSKERNKVVIYYEIGKLLNKAGNKYGDNVIEKYSLKLVQCWTTRCFIYFWYYTYINLDNREIFLYIFSIKGIVKEKSYISIISLVVLIAAGVLIITFPFKDVKFKYELNKYEESRLEIVDKIKTNKLKPKDENGNVVLPNKYKKYSISGEVVVYQNDKDGQVIGFWIFRGIQSGSTQLMYSTGGENLIKSNERGHPITEIEKLKDNWYLVTTDY